MTETVEPGVSVPPAPKKRGNLRAYLILGVLVVFLGVVFYEAFTHQSADDLVAGSCFDLPSGDAATLAEVTRRNCTEAHDAEVFKVIEYPSATDYPIDLTFESFVEDTCNPAFETYVGQPYESSNDLTINFFYPTSDSWANGDRTVTCYATRVDEAKLTQSIQGSAAS